MPFESFDEVAAASENNLPIHPKRQLELLKISNNIWNYMTALNNCTALESQLVAAMVSTYAHGQGGEK